MAIANGTCVSFCNQPKAKFGYLTRVTPVCRCFHPFCGWRHLATSRESKAHFSLPSVRASIGQSRNVAWTERGFNARQNRCSMYPSIFNCFLVIQPVSSKVGHFSIFFARFRLLWVRPWNNRVNVTWMERGFNAGQTHRSMCMPIHL